MSTENFPAIIREAATSPLGILALIILLLATLAVAFFGKSSEQIRMRVWISFFVGGSLLFGLAVLRESNQGRTGSLPANPAQPGGAANALPLEERPRQETAADPQATRRGTVQIGYQGDMFNCSLPVTIDIGDRSLQPQGQLARFDEVPLGLQSYRIVGSIQCPYAGFCSVDSTGRIEVVAGRTYYLIWQASGAPNRCDAMLQLGS